ncbi:MAG: TRAP transporter substrate-binding protein [Clostridia bacterium]|nr:TRAP transporter substrate-binding protein [Clostridia bacterium]
MKKKFLLLSTLIISLALLVVGCSGGEKAASTSDGQKSVTFKLGHVTQVSHPYHKAAEAFKAKVEKETNGRIKINIYPARQLGGDRDMLEQIQNGSLDMGFISSAVFSGFTPVLDGLQLPFLMQNYDVLGKAVKTDEAKALLDALKNINVKGLAFYDAGFRHFVTVENPVSSPQDLKGLKLRVVESPLMLDIFNTLGTSPTPMPYGEIYSALQTGVIDGLEMDLSAIWAEKHYEVAKNVSLSSHFSFPTVNIINMDKWNNLSKEDQEIMQKAAWEVIDENQAYIKQVDQECLNNIKKQNINVTEIKDLTPFIEATKPVYDKHTAKDPLVKQFVDKVQAIKAETK